MRMITSRSGQALLICVLIGMVLLLTIPVIVFVNMSGSKHHVAAVKQDKAAAIAEEGLAYAIQILSVTDPPNNPPTVWKNAMNNGSFPAPECNGASDIVGADGGHFRLKCAIGNGCPVACQPYQVYVKATAYMPDPSQPSNYVPAHAIEAYLSQRTIAASLPTGRTAGAALRLATVPTLAANSNLAVNWGPILLTDSVNTWFVGDRTDSSNSPLVAGTQLLSWPSQMDTKRYPRKFSPGGIAGDSAADGAFPGFATRSPTPNVLPNSDQQEYWSWTDVGFPLHVDVAAYTAIAQAESNFVAPTNWPYSTTLGTPIPPTGCTTPPGTNCGYFNVPVGDVAIFGRVPEVTYGDYTAPSPGSVIFVKGDAIFNEVILNLPTGAIIVTGNMTLGNLGTLAGNPANTMAFHIPPTAHLEYPYYPNWPYKAQEDTNASNVSNILGFLYAGTSLTVTPNDDGKWIFRGVIVADGTFTMNASSCLALWYLDRVNRGILVTDFKLMIDSQREVSAN